MLLLFLFLFLFFLLLFLPFLIVRVIIVILVVLVVRGVLVRVVRVVRVARIVLVAFFSLLPCCRSCCCCPCCPCCSCAHLQSPPRHPKTSLAGQVMAQRMLIASACPALAPQASVDSFILKRITKVRHCLCLFTAFVAQTVPFIAAPRSERSWTRPGCEQKRMAAVVVAKCY